MIIFINDDDYLRKEVLTDNEDNNEVVIIFGRKNIISSEVYGYKKKRGRLKKLGFSFLTKKKEKETINNLRNAGFWKKFIPEIPEGVIWIGLSKNDREQVSELMKKSYKKLEKILNKEAFKAMKQAKNKKDIGLFIACLIFRKKFEKIED